MRPFIDLDKQPVKTDLYMWADYIEMLCLAQPDGVISRADVLDRYRDKRDIRRGASRKQSPKKDSFAERTDAQEQRAIDWFEHLDFRSKAFNEAYPFVLSDDKTTLMKKGRITRKHKLYVYLLASSNLRWFSKVTANTLVSSFEVVSTIALRKYVTKNGVAYIFGKNPLNQGRYSGSLWNKISQFSADIFETPRYKEEDYKTSDTGDRGLDIVAWIPFKDQVEGFAVFLAQCACGEGWTDKQLTSTSARWGKLINFSLPPNNVVFIPICFRNANGGWYDRTRIDEGVLIDRLRLVLLIGKHASELPVTWPEKIVDKVLAVRDTLV